MKTLAQQFADRMGNNGQIWEDPNGTEFEIILMSMDAKVTYSARDHSGAYVDVDRDRYIDGDPIRYEFPDGSAIVEAMDAWDIEGPTRFSLKSTS